MKRSSRIDRRRFLGRTAAAVGVVATSSGLLPSVRSSFRWGTAQGFPDGPATLEIHLDRPEVDGWVELSMRIETPHEVLNKPLGRHPVQRGAVHLETHLVYPYEDRVRGEYRYVVELTTSDGTTHASPAIGYAIRRQVPFV